MGVISSIGTGSGIDIKSLVDGLVTAEGQPKFDAINRQESAAKTRLSGLGSLKSALSTFQTAVRKLNDVGLFKTYQAASNDESTLKATASAGAAAGSHTIEVTQLAKAQKSTTTAEFTGLNDTVSAGNLAFTMGNGSTFSVTVGSNNNTLAGVRDAINNASDNKGVTASIINVDSTANPGTTISKLVLTARDAGAANSFSVSGGDARLNSAAATTTAAADAKITIDGETATRSTNEMTDVVQGITLSLKKLGTVNVDVTLDQEAISKSVTEFVSAYNNLTTVTKGLGKYGGPGATGSGNGPLLGDSTLRSISSQLRQNTTNPVISSNSGYNSLAMIGVKVDKDGLMTASSTELKKALSTNVSSVSNVFTSTDGVATRLNTKLTEFLSSGGSLESQTKSLNTQLTSLGGRRDAVQARLDSLQKSLQKQFIAMDVAVGQFKSTGSFLTSRFG